MKKIIATTLSLALLLGTAGCSTQQSSNTVDNEKISKLQKENESLKKEIESLNNTTTSIEETTKETTTTETKSEKIEEVILGNPVITNDMEITVNNIELTYDVLPEDTSGYYTHYASEKGKVYIHVDMDVKNNAKQQLNCDEIMKITADYNNGFEYSGFTVVEDDSTGFTYASISVVDPLETKGIRFLIDCPQEVEESENPLHLIFDIGGSLYTYKMR